MNLVAIKTCDLVVVGGGIAGLSIAERAAREASRQGRSIRILLVDAANELGTGASGSIEAWFHTGTLYATHGDKATLFTFLNSLEDLYNWYRCDPLFKHRDHCNFHPPGESACMAYDFSWPPRVSWFHEELPYVLPGNLTSPRTSGVAEQAEQLRRIGDAQRYIASLFHGADWRGEDRLFCRAPSQRGTLPALSNECASRVESRDRGARERLREVLARLSRNGYYSSLDVMLTRDAVMNSWLIMNDLASSAAALGVETLLGQKLDASSIQIPEYGDPETVSGILLKSASGGYTHVLARQYLFALGAGFDEFGLLRERLGMRLRVKKTTSVMVTVTPALFPASFVRIGSQPTDAFNHVFRVCCDPADSSGYSMIADGNALADEVSVHACAGAAVNLLSNAAKFFDFDLSEANASWYSCKKTEFPVGEDAERRYAYWWGPACGQWSTEKWRIAREPDRQAATESTILRNVLANRPGECCAGIGHPLESSWALKKALHYCLLKVMSEQQRPSGGGGSQASTATFSSFQDYLAEAFSTAKGNNRFHSSPADDGLLDAQQHRGELNFICVVPGKFSLFPSVAHNVYLELEARGLFRLLPKGRAGAFPQPPVALPKAEQPVRIVKEFPKKTYSMP